MADIFKENATLQGNDADNPDIEWSATHTGDETSHTYRYTASDGSEYGMNAGGEFEVIENTDGLYGSIVYEGPVNPEGYATRLRFGSDGSMDMVVYDADLSYQENWESNEVHTEDWQQSWGDWKTEVEEKYGIDTSSFIEEY